MKSEYFFSSDYNRKNFFFLSVLRILLYDTLFKKYSHFVVNSTINRRQIVHSLDKEKSIFKNNMLWIEIYHSGRARANYLNFKINDTSSFNYRIWLSV